MHITQKHPDELGSFAQKIYVFLLCDYVPIVVKRPGIFILNKEEKNRFVPRSGFLDKYYLNIITDYRFVYIFYSFSANR